ncbi:DUF4197 domain-containing protein [Desulfatitalea tepidiphila]|uniref:DUF4197 domain-containing protein n=1 Tax=Desulfatitalea tepidiphila TaxID=1185843 RepID=UPI0006B58832|nr:DUF4197 domain-containing protein [Desulfatitalea tepidiphila]
MSRRKAAYCAVVSLLLAMTVFACQGGMDGVLGQVARELQASQGLGQSDIVAGLKEALRVGTENAVDVTSKLNGYYSNPEIKIPLPENVRKVENVLRMAGLGQQVTSFEQSMNRAAERAAPEAKALFVGAIKQMTFADAKKILNGRENEATLFFKDKTYHALGQRFQPLVHDAMAEVGVTRYYQTLEDKIRVLPVKGLMDVDLDQYVTDKALDGLFVMLAQEEAKIRTDPAARVTDILKKVFGSQR